MERIMTYSDVVQDVIEEYANLSRANQDIDIQTIFDTTHDHYQLVYTGWRGKQRLYGCVVHIDIKDHKIWIQWDGTEVGIANVLVERGVPKEDIVLAFHSPSKRKYTGFAVG